MVCLNPIIKSPFLASVVAASCVMLYYMMMSYNRDLPPAVIISIMVGIFVYVLMGGTLICKEPEIDGSVVSNGSTDQYEYIPVTVLHDLQKCK